MDPIALDGFRYRLRPVCEDDACAMIALRTAPRNVAYLHPTSLEPSIQRCWITQKLHDPTDRTLILEDRTHLKPVGFFSVYDIDEECKNGRYGRWATKSPMIVPEFAFLGFSYIFDILGLDAVYAKIPDNNLAAVAFQGKIGATLVDECAGYTILLEKEVKLLHFQVRSQAWPQIRQTLLRNVRRRL